MLPDDLCYRGENYHEGETALILHYTHTDTTDACVKAFRRSKRTRQDDASFWFIDQAIPNFPWDRICIFNYIHKAPRGSGFKFEPKSHRHSEPGLKKDLMIHRPRRVLVLGQTHWEPEDGLFTSSVDIARQVLEPRYQHKLIIEKEAHPIAWRGDIGKDKLSERYRLVWKLVWL